jgi:hypothetical protein
VMKGFQGAMATSSSVSIDTKVAELLTKPYALLNGGANTGVAC